MVQPNELPDALDPMADTLPKGTGLGAHAPPAGTSDSGHRLDPSGTVP